MFMSENSPTRQQENFDCVFIVIFMIQICLCVGHAIAQNSVQVTRT